MIGALIGIVVTAGLVLVVTGLRGRDVPLGRPDRPTRQPINTRDVMTKVGKRAVPAGVAFAAGLALAVTDGWVIAPFALPAAVLAVSWMWAPDPTIGHTDRLEAMGEWTRALGSMMIASSIGLPEAITSSVRSSPEAIRTEVATVSARLNNRWRAEDALWGLADDLNDPTGDLIATTLILGSRERGAKLARVLKQLAEAVANQVTIRRETESDRSSLRSASRILSVIIVGGFTGFLVLVPAIADFYHSPPGQLVLAVLITALGGCLYWMHKVSKIKAPSRFLIRPGTRPVATAGGVR